MPQFEDTGREFPCSINSTIWSVPLEERANGNDKFAPVQSILNRSGQIIQLNKILENIILKGVPDVILVDFPGLCTRPVRQV